MALCQLCSSIPFSELPDFPPSFDNTQSKWDYIHAFIENTANRHGGPPGWPHHPTLEALSVSATSCELCRLILDQVDLFIAEFRAAEQDEFFRRTFNKGYPTFKLWFTKRRGGADGFWVISTGRERGRDRESIFLLAAVGFCVEEGTNNPGSDRKNSMHSISRYTDVG